MASSNPGSKRPDHDRGDYEHREPPCDDCDLHGVDELACESKGIADQAAYIAAHAKALADRRAGYDTTRTAYTKARADVAANVNGIRKDLHQIREQLRCQIDDDVLDCLDRAWDEVVERLERCGEPAEGCCVGDCDLDAETEGYDNDTILQLTARIARIERHVTQAEVCFDKLVGEPVALTGRVTDLRLLVDALLAEIADTKNVDPKHAYATLRRLWHRFDDLWAGFRHARQFHDCLCRALTCSAAGRRILGILTGRLGVLTCNQKAEDDRCTWLRTHVVEEVLAICAREHEPEHYDGGGHPGGGYRSADSEPESDDSPPEPENTDVPEDSDDTEDEEETIDAAAGRRNRSSW
jgi:hypothetical protein